PLSLGVGAKPCRDAYPWPTREALQRPVRPTCLNDRLKTCAVSGPRAHAIAAGASEIVDADTGSFLTRADVGGTTRDDRVAGGPAAAASVTLILPTSKQRVEIRTRRGSIFVGFRGGDHDVT